MEDLFKMLYRTVFNLLGRPGGWPMRATRRLAQGFTFVTPAFAAPYQIAHSSKLLTPLSGAIFCAALVQCLFLTGFMAGLSGTWRAMPGCSVEFREDKWNILLYLLVCPAYVTLCVRLVLLSMERDPGQLGPLAESTAGQTRRVFLCLFLVSVFSSVLITNYVNDAMDSTVVEPAYWFVDSVAGIRRLNAAGLYYIVLNFALLFITFLGGAGFIAVSIDGIRLARELLDSGRPIELDIYELRVKRLLHAYFFGTLLAAAYSINIYIWQLSPLGATKNIHVAATALTALGIFFVAIPKQYIDYVWARYAERRDADIGQRGLEPAGVRMPHPQWGRVIYWANVMWLGTWFAGYYGLGEYLDAPSMLRRLLGPSSDAVQAEERPTRFEGCRKPLAPGPAPAAGARSAQISPQPFAHLD